MSAYEAVQKGGLKLKGVSDHGSKKKKKKDKEKKKMQEALELEQQVSPTEESPRPQKTKAEIAFEKRKWKRLEEQMVEKVSKSHKDRIMEFNRHLDSLTEHFDIPKVSWTK